MSITLQYIVDQALQIAVGKGGDAHQSPLNDSGFTAESLVPIVSRYVIKRLLESGQTDECLIVHEISLTNGVGELPATVLREFLEHAYLPDFPYASRCEYFSDYNRHRYGQIDYWAIQGKSVYFSGNLNTEETTRAVINCTIINAVDSLQAPVGTGGFLADIGKRVVISVAAVDVLDTTLISASDDDNATMEDPAPQNSAAATATIYTTTGDALRLAAVSYPEIPTNIDSAIEISETAANLIISTIAGVLLGEIPLAEINR